MKKYYNFGLILILILVVALSGCGGGNSGPKNQKSSFIVLDLHQTAGSTGFIAFRAAADSGSQIVSRKFGIDAIELKSAAGAYVTIYSGAGTELETVGRGFGTITDILTFNSPPAGTYTGFRFKVSKIATKAKIKLAGIAQYKYTTNQDMTITQGMENDAKPAWELSDDENDWGYATHNYDGGLQVNVDFPAPLVVSGSGPVNIVWALDIDNDKVFYDVHKDTNNITYIYPDEKVNTILPAKPATRVDLSLDGHSIDNVLSLFFDANGSLLNGYCHRMKDSVFNGNYLYKAELTNIQDNGAKVDGFVLTFYDADLDRFDPDYNYVVTGNYDCNNTPSCSVISLTPSDATATANGVQDYTITSSSAYLIHIPNK